MRLMRMRKMANGEGEGWHVAYGHKTTAPHTVMSVTRLFVSFIVSSHQLYQIVELDDSL